MAEAVKKPRPEFRNIGIGQTRRQYRLPLAGQGLDPASHKRCCCCSSLCRSCCTCFDQSLTSELSFEVVQGLPRQPHRQAHHARAVWAYLFHFCAGIRHLLHGRSHVSVSKEGGKQTSHRRAGRLVAADARVGAQTVRSLLRTWQPITESARSASSSARITVCATGSRSASPPSSWRSTPSSCSCWFFAAHDFSYDGWASIFAIAVDEARHLRHACSRCSITRGSACATSGWTT